MEIIYHIEEILKLLIKDRKILFPQSEIVKIWNSVLVEWLEDDIIPLFVRKAGGIRGSKIITSFKRELVITDNTPAHWVFKMCALDNTVLSKKQIIDLISANQLPISFMRKKSEKETLIGGMVADKSTRLNESGWKLAHIDRIALKRGANLTAQDYKNHHFKFLSLSNMYLIDKSFSGLAEVGSFNEIIKTYKEANLI